MTVTTSGLSLGLSIPLMLALGCGGGGSNGTGGTAGMGGTGGSAGTGGTGGSGVVCEEGVPQQKTVGVGCRNNITSAQSPFMFGLSVEATSPIVGGGEFSVVLDGFGVFPEFFLDASQLVIPCGVRVAELTDFVSTVQVRSGASGPDVRLSFDEALLSPGATRLCNFPANQTCTVDSECAGQTCNPPVLLQQLPVIDGVPNSPGGCDASGCSSGGQPPPDCDCSPCFALSDEKGAQCTKNGFCVNGDLIVEFESAEGTYTAGASGGQVLFGWSDQDVDGVTLCPAPAPLCPFSYHVDGCYHLPAASPVRPPEPIGIRLSAGGLAVQIQCAMAEDGGECTEGGGTGTGVGCICNDPADVDGDCASATCGAGETCVGVGQDNDIVCPTRNGTLISCLIN